MIFLLSSALLSCSLFNSSAAFFLSKFWKQTAQSITHLFASFPFPATYSELLLAGRSHEASLLLGSGRLLEPGSDLGLSLGFLILKRVGRG